MVWIHSQVQTQYSSNGLEDVLVNHYTIARHSYICYYLLIIKNLKYMVWGPQSGLDAIQ